MRPAEQLTTADLPASATLAIPSSKRVLEVFRDDSGWHQRESEPDVFQTDHRLDYAVGSGVNGFTFLVRRDNYLFQAPLSFYSKTGKWGPSPGYEQIDLGFSRMVPLDCIACHAGRAVPRAGRPGAYADPPFQDLAVGCENCHGPGEAHVKALGKKTGLIVNPAKLPPRLAENICISCHQTGDARVLRPGKTIQDFRPGQWLSDTALILKAVRTDQNTHESDLLEHYTAMQASQCFRASAGKLSCLSCHDPHIQPTADAPDYFRKRCMTCHSEGANIKNCSLPAKTRLAQTPPNDCSGCHMPKRLTERIAHSALTNHRIPAREGEQIPDLPVPEIDGLIVLNRRPGAALNLSDTTRLQAYRDLSSQSPQYIQRYVDLLGKLARSQPTDPFLQAALGHKAMSDGRSEEAVEHLTKALPLGESAVHLDLAQSLVKLGRGEEAIEYLKKGIDLDPYNALLQKTLILQYINDKQYVNARQRMEQYAERFPEDSFMRSLLARVK